MAKPRKKKRTHQEDVKDPSKKGDPKSFVFRRGRYGLIMADLESDLRRVMSPNTASNLRESKRNVLKDFVHIAGPLGVTHFVILTATQNASYLRVAKSPRGPTLTMRVHSYTLMRDVASAQSHPRRPASLWEAPPLLVMNNFTGGSHLKLATVMFQNLFPTLNVTNVRLGACQRVVLLDYQKNSGRILFRHFSIYVTPSGVSKGVKTLVGRKALPDMSDMADVSEFLTKSGYGSESEGEEANESRVSLPQDLGKGNLAARQSRVHLQEIGPRMELDIVKAEEGLCEGKVLYHMIETRTAEEVAALDAAKDEATKADEARALRKQEQEENVRKKAAAKAAATGGGSKPAKKPWWQQELDSAAAEKRSSKAEDDIIAYRAEVGEEPEANFSAGPSSKQQERPRGTTSTKDGKTRPASDRKQMAGEGMGGTKGLVRKRKADKLKAKALQSGKKRRPSTDAQGGDNNDGTQKKKRRRDFDGLGRGGRTDGADQKGAYKKGSSTHEGSKSSSGNKSKKPRDPGHKSSKSPKASQATRGRGRT